MTNTLIRITYDGTAYSGFQLQINAPTVQEALERALEVIYKQPVRVIGASRTDAGVHARGQAANYQAPFRIAAEKLPYALNTLLPPDIVVTEAQEVGEKFHARFDGRRKIYSYSIDLAAYPQVMKRSSSWHLLDRMDLKVLDEAARLFEGTHDFKPFRATGTVIADTTRTIYRVEPLELPEEQFMVIYFEGSGFLYRMVRLITGSLVRAGKGLVTLNEIKAALAGINPAAIGPTAPAHGLCLEKVFYEL